MKANNKIIKIPLKYFSFRLFSKATIPNTLNTIVKKLKVQD